MALDFLDSAVEERLDGPAFDKLPITNLAGGDEQFNRSGVNTPGVVG